MTVPAPSVCPNCGGEGEVLQNAHPLGTSGLTVVVWCPACRCVLCGVPSLEGLCEACRIADEIEDDQRHVRAADV